MAEEIKEVFYTLDEETRELVARGIQIGDGLKIIMQISKKYITGKKEDEQKLVNVDLGSVVNISTSLNRKTTRDYIPGQRDAYCFSRGHVIGNGRLIGAVLDREIITTIFGTIHENAPEAKMFNMVEGQDTFGAEFEIGEQTEQDITENKDSLVGGTNAVFTKKKKYIYLDDLPIFDLRFLARADSELHINMFGLPNEKEYRTGAIYEKIVKRVSFVGRAGGMNAIDALSNETVDFMIFGNDSGWKPLKTSKGVR